MAIYGAELVVYDRHKRCQLTDGDYELALTPQDMVKNITSKKQATWETVMDGKVNILNLFSEKYLFIM